MKIHRVIMLVLVAIYSFVSCKSEIEAKVEKTLKGMDLDTKIGQMVQLNIDLVIDDEGLDEAKMESVFGRWKVYPECL